MPKLNLKIPKALADDLRQIALFGTGPLDSAAERLDRQPSCIIKPSELRKVIGEAVTSAQTPIVERVVLGLSNLRRQSGAPVEDVLEGLGRVADQYDWDEELVSSWKSVHASLRRLLNNRSIIVTAKAVDLLYDYDHFFVGAKILSDVRPVFDDEKAEIVGAVINQTLRVEFTDGSGKQTDISLIVDLDDIERIAQSCKEALIKGRIIEQQLKEKWKIETLTIDEIKNDRG